MICAWFLPFFFFHFNVYNTCNSETICYFVGQLSNILELNITWKFSFLFYVEDTPPVLSNLPSTQSVNTPPGEPGAVVTWPEPTATDDRSTPTITVSHPSGTLFPIGRTTVTITAVDAEGLTDVHTFQITVIGMFHRFGFLKCIFIVEKESTNNW